jgi:hypothetical protein
MEADTQFFILVIITIGLLLQKDTGRSPPTKLSEIRQR